MTFFFELFFVFFKIGAFTFGGGYAMIPLIQKEVVDRKNWLNEKEFVDMLAIAQSMPGPIALNTALFVGNKHKGFKGSLFAGLGIILPSFIIILFIAIAFTQFRENSTVEAVFKGIRPAVVALIAAPLIKLARLSRVNWHNIWIPITVALLVWQVNLSPIYIVIAAILGGIIRLIYLKRKQKKVN